MCASSGCFFVFVSLHPSLDTCIRFKASGLLRLKTRPKTHPEKVGAQDDMFLLSGAGDHLGARHTG